jgi:hypothetical protein
MPDMGSMIYDQRTKDRRCPLNPCQRWIFLRRLRCCGSLARQQARRTRRVCRKRICKGAMPTSLRRRPWRRNGDDGGGHDRSVFLAASNSGCDASTRWRRSVPHDAVVLRSTALGKKKGRSCKRPAFPITRQDLQGAINQGLFSRGGGIGLLDGELLERVLYHFYQHAVARR